MDMTYSESVWVITIATFLAVALIPIFAFFIINKVVRNRESGKQTRPIVDRRRSKRFEVSLPVFVYGHQSEAEPFSENATVLQASADGGLLTLASNVRVGQELLLETMSAQDLRQSCWVARLGPSSGSRKQVAVKFARPAPGFWLKQAK
jgi:hypothetical protein